MHGRICTLLLEYIHRQRNVPCFITIDTIVRTSFCGQYNYHDSSMGFIEWYNLSTDKPDILIISLRQARRRSWAHLQPIKNLCPMVVIVCKLSSVFRPRISFQLFCRCMISTQPKSFGMTQLSPQQHYLSQVQEMSSNWPPMRLLGYPLWLPSYLYRWVNDFHRWIFSLRWGLCRFTPAAGGLHRITCGQG